MNPTLRRTKIVCTLGPSSDDPALLEELIRSGMNVARLNFSHGNPAEHGQRIQRIREVSARLDRPVAILQDLSGPKIRIGSIPDPGVVLQPGALFVLSTAPREGSEEGVFVSYPDLPAEVRPGDRLLLADGLLEMTVLETLPEEVVCRVVQGGVLTSSKGINLPTGTLRTPALTEKDREDLLFGLARGVDYVALSFVRTAEDIQRVREIIRDRGGDVPVVAKIEKHEAVEHLEAILAVSDGVMVARGDLGVEIPPEDVPLLQKRIISAAVGRGKFVITATQMLRSMVSSPRPTRAEAADVANAVLDGTDAVMLSEETASGDYPVEAVRYMDRICRAAETGFPYRSFLEMAPEREVPQSVAHAACVLADHLDARAIAAYTYSGATARFIARFRPRQPIIALTPSQTAAARLAMIWGCQPLLVRHPENTDRLLEEAAVTLSDTGRLSPGDLVVMTLGYPLWQQGTTHMLQVKRV